MSVIRQKSINNVTFNAHRLNTNNTKYVS